MLDALLSTIEIAGSGLDSQSARVRVASENLANMESTGNAPGANPYTRKTISFDSIMDEATGADLVNTGSIDLDTSPYRIERNPAHPAADASGNVKLPNVDMLVELADIREANRSYEANIQVIKQARDMISMTIDLMRTNS